MKKDVENSSVFGDVIYSYTRKQAIEDGVLVEVDRTLSRQAGIIHPVALTREVFERYVRWDEKDNDRQAYQDETGRLWDILWMCFNYLKNAVKNGKHNTGGGILFVVHVIPRNEKSRARCPRKTILKCIVGPGDDAEPVITILLPDED